ncbi:STAS-like domain-containing protein [Magnetococcales bacterium HHB-1]
MELSIRQTIGPRCIIQEDGQKIFDSIHSAIKNGENVILNFEGVNQFASPFFNFAIGQLLKEISKDDLERHLTMEHLNQTGQIVVKQVIENAARYHSDKDYSQIVDDILKQSAQEHD